MRGSVVFLSRPRVLLVLALGLLLVAGSAFAVLRGDGDPESRRDYLRGVNVFTFGYASSNPEYPGEPASGYRFLAGRGQRLVRIPFFWTQVQPSLGGPLDPAGLEALADEVGRADAAGLRVVLSLHNGCRFPKVDSRARCGDGISEQQLTDVWLRLSSRFAKDRGVIAYDIMNEPYEIEPGLWESFSQAVVNGLRGRGDTKLLWIEASGYSSPKDFARRHPRAWINDPADKVMYSAHQYFDGSGTYQNGFDFDSYDTGEVIADLILFTRWLSENGARGSVGEVGWPSSTRTDSWQLWNDLGEDWYRVADEARLWVTYFSATSAYDEKQSVYDSPANGLSPIPGISVARSQSKVIEQHLGR